MKESEAKNLFVELRAAGKSFDKISDELKVSKPTLIKWSKEFQHQISNLKAVELEALREKYLMSKEHEVKLFRGFIDKIQIEMEKKDFSNYSFEELLAMFNTFKGRLHSEMKIQLTEKVPHQYSLEDKIETWYL